MTPGNKSRIVERLLPADRRPPVLASIRYRQHADALRGRSVAEIFDYIFRTNLWGSDESHSGQGSELGATATLRARLPGLLREIGATSLLDAPCGDFGWLSLVPLTDIDYVGVDIVPEIIRRNNTVYASPRRRFAVLDLIVDDLPKADVILCRDCLVHLTYAQIFAAIANFRRNGAKYLLTTTFVEIDRNRDIATGDWRPLNLCLPPFNFPEPIDVIVEGCTEADGHYADKSLGLWLIDQLPINN